MEPAAWGLIGSLFGAVVGASSSVLTTAINARHSLKLQAAGKELERAARFSSFQQETLLSVQSAVQNLTRLMAQAYLAQRKAFAETGEWKLKPLEKDLDNDLGQANRVLFNIAERVADDELRRKIRQLHENITTVYTTKSPDEAKTMFFETAQEFNSVMECLGVKLRSLY